MRITRREFVRCGAVAAMAASVRAAPLAAHPSGAAVAVAGPPRGPFDLATFAAHVATSFRVTGEKGAVSRLQLTRVDDLATAAEKRTAGPSQERFSLIFHAPCDCPLRQGLHQVDHPVLGRFPLFIVPMRSRDGRRPVYEATFNRYVPTA